MSNVKRFLLRYGVVVSELRVYKRARFGGEALFFFQTTSPIEWPKVKTAQGSKLKTES